MLKLYEENEDFKNYVDAYARKYMEGRSISVEEALTHKIVQEVGKQYMSQKRSI